MAAGPVDQWKVPELVPVLRALCQKHQTQRVTGAVRVLASLAVLPYSYVVQVQARAVPQAASELAMEPVV